MLQPPSFRNYFTSFQIIHNIGTRQSQKGGLFALFCNTTLYGLRSIHYTGKHLCKMNRLWNSLPLKYEIHHPFQFFEKN